MNSPKLPHEIRVPLGDAQSAAPNRDEIPRIVRLLALAHRWHRLIDEGEIRDQAEVARRVGLTRARVTQIMELRWLSPQLQAIIVCSRLRPSGLLQARIDEARRSASWIEHAELSG